MMMHALIYGVLASDQLAVVLDELNSCTRRQLPTSVVIESSVAQQPCAQSIAGGSTGFIFATCHGYDHPVLCFLGR
jgi:hypothetical protein